MFVARLGSFDFSNYLRVGPGEGLDPYDGDGFLEPAFNDGPFGDGQPLLNVDRRNRLMQWPLYLKDSETAVTNLHKDPGGEGDASQWQSRVIWAQGVSLTAGGSTITKDTSAPAFGTSAVKVVLANSVNLEGVEGVPTVDPTNNQFDSGVVYRWDVFLKGNAGGEQLQLVLTDTAGTDANTGLQTVTLTTSWARYSVTWTPAANRAGARYAIRNNAGPDAFTFFADGGMVARASSIQPFGDGDQAGWKWNGEVYNSSSSSLVGKDGLHELVQILNREITNPANKPLRLQWRDHEATNTTFYDVAFARFDPDFHFRRSQQGWAAGVLRVWCSPAYGHTATYRVVASAAGSGVLLTAPIASSPIGDAPALLDAQIQTGSYVDKDGRLIGLSVLPHPSYVCDVPAASLLNGVGASLIGASGAAGSQVLGVLYEGTSLGSQALPAFDVALSPASHYEGRHRVLAIARANHLSGIGLRAFDGVDPIGPTVVASQFHEGYGVVDLGVWSPKIRTTNPTALLRVSGGGMPATGGMSIATNATGAHGLIINRIIVLPEDTTTFLLDSEREPVAHDSFSRASLILTNGHDELGNAYATVSAFPPYADPTHKAIITNAPHDTISPSGYGNVAAKLDAQVSDFQIVADVRMRQHTAGGTGLIVVGKRGTAEGAAVTFGGGPSPYVNIAVSAHSGVFASAGVAFSVYDKDVRLEFGTKGKRSNTAVWFAGSLLASAGGSSARANNDGVPYVELSATRTQASPWALMRSWAVYSLPSTAQPARSVYHLTPSGAEIQDNASVFLRDVAGEQIAQTPQAVPSSAAVAVFSMPLNGGPANDLLGVEVRANERFQYGR